MAGRPIGAVPPVPPADDHVPGDVGLDELRDPVDFSALIPPADEASDGITMAGVTLADLVPDFFL